MKFLFFQYEIDSLCIVFFLKWIILNVWVLQTFKTNAFYLKVFVFINVRKITEGLLDKLGISYRLELWRRWIAHLRTLTTSPLLYVYIVVCSRISLFSLFYKLIVCMLILRSIFFFKFSVFLHLWLCLFIYSSYSTFNHYRNSDLNEHWV